MWNWMRMLVAGLCVLAMSACGGGGNTQQTEGPPPFDIKITHVDQWSQLASKVPDGQYVVVTMKVKNQSNTTQELNPWDFEVQNITTVAEEQYSQASESVGGEFYNAYGAEKHAQLLDNAAHTLHPRIEVVRYIVFQLPRSASMGRYQVYFKPQDLKMPLEGDEIEVTDHRENTGELSEEETVDEEAATEPAAEPAAN